MTIAKRCDNWRWPGEKDWPWQVEWSGKPLLPNLAHLRLAASDPDIFSADLNVLYFPSGRSDNYTPHNPANTVLFASLIDPKDLSQIDKVLAHETSKTRPGDGEDAFPGGMPGKGGDGGAIASTLHPLTEQFCNADPGEHGPPTKAIPGKDPGTPNPAYRATMVIRKRVWPNLSKLALFVEDVTAKKGKDALERKQTSDRKRGSITVIGTGGATCRDEGAIRLPTGKAKAWADPLAVDAILAYAKDAYRNGFRADAGSLLEPYFAELSCVAESDLGPDLSARLTAIDAIRRNLMDNVDFFGHPPSWVPRLRAETNFAIYREVRKTATDLLLFARGRIAAFDARNVNAVKTEEISSKLWAEIESRRTQVEDSAKQLSASRETIAELATKVAAVQVDIENLRTWTADQARDKVKAQRVFKGVMKLVGGAMKVFPLGQPYLGLGGDVFAGVGDFNWNKKDAAAQWEPILKGIGGKVDGFLKDNKDLIAKDWAPDPQDPTKRRKLEDDLSATQRDLKTKEAEQAATAEVFKNMWTSDKSEYLKKKQARLDAWKKENDTLSDPNQKKNAEAKYNNVIAALGLEEAADFFATGIKLNENVAKLEAEIAKANEAEKLRLRTEKEELANFKKKVDEAEQAKKAADTAAAREKEDREKATGDVKSTLDRLKVIGSGVGEIGAGIAALASPVSPDDPEVKAIVDEILNTKQEFEIPNEQRDKYRKLLKDVAEIQSSQQAAVRTMLGAQQAIAANTAAIAQGLAAASDLAHRSQLVSSVDDTRVRRHLMDMQTRARDMLQWSLYHFVMAFRYEFLMDAPRDIFNIDAIVDAVVKDATVDDKGNKIKDASGKDMTFETISPEAYAKSEEKVLKDYLFRIAKALIDRRQIKNAPEGREISSPYALYNSVDAATRDAAKPPAAAPAAVLPQPPAAAAPPSPPHFLLVKWVSKTAAWLENSPPGPARLAPSGRRPQNGPGLPNKKRADQKDRLAGDRARGSKLSTALRV